MTKSIRFDKNAFKDFSQWAIENKMVFMKIVEFINEIQSSPFKGTGKPEPLKFGNSGYWSRRITLEHRLVYKVTDNEIFIVSCRGHY